jgi:hypothetical protein
MNGALASTGFPPMRQLAVNAAKAAIADISKISPVSLTHLSADVFCRSVFLL